MGWLQVPLHCTVPPQVPQGLPKSAGAEPPQTDAGAVQRATPNRARESEATEAPVSMQTQRSGLLPPGCLTSERTLTAARDSFW